MPLGNWNGDNNNSSFCVPSLPRNSQASELQSILLAGHTTPPRKMLAPSTPLLWGSPPRFKAWDDTKEQKNYYYYLRWYKRTGWEAGGGTNTKTLSSAHLLANCTKKTTISHTDTKVTSYSSICITGPASAPRFNREKKRHARHQKIKWESLKRKPATKFLDLSRNTPH